MHGYNNCGWNCTESACHELKVAVLDGREMAHPMYQCTVGIFRSCRG